MRHTQPQWEVVVPVTLALLLVSTWVNIVGFGTVFTAIGVDVKLTRYCYHVGRIVFWMILLLLPVQVDKAARGLAWSVPLALTTTTLFFVVAPTQTFFASDVVGAACSVIMVGGYTWMTAACSIELARECSLRWFICIVAVCQTLEQVLSVVLNFLLEPAAQAIVCSLMVLACGMMMLIAQRRICKPRAQTTRSIQLTGRAKTHLFVLLATAGVACFLIGAVSDVGVWGIVRPAYDSFDFFGALASGLASCAVMLALVALTMLAHPYEQLALRYQIPFLVLVAGYMLAVMDYLVSGSSVPYIHIVIDGIEYFSHVLVWTIVATAVQSIDTPAYRSAAVMGVSGGIVGVMWLACFENDPPIAALATLMAVYLILIAIVVHPRVLQRRAADSAHSFEELNEYTLEGEPAIPLAASAGAVEGIINDRVALAAGHYRLSPRETEVLGLLVQGRTVSAIQRQLSISEGTVKTHIAHIYEKTGVHSRETLYDLVCRGKLVE